MHLDDRHQLTHGQRRDTGRRCRPGERGSATLELVVVFPVVLLLIIGGVQGALYYHARSVALAAAQDGARAAAVEGATAGAGQAAAAAFIQATGGDEVLPGAQVDATRTPTTAAVTVTGRALTVLAIPGLSLAVRQSASLPVERIT